MFPEVHETTVDGIPTFWADLPGPFTGTLVFGVGTRDEPVQLAGITHLVEHLLLRRAAPLRVDHNGSVDHERLDLHAWGEPGDVVEFLHDIVSAVESLASVDEEDLSREKSIIRAEHGRPSGLRPDAGLLTYRFGVGTIGKAHASLLTEWSITPDEASRWARTWLTRANAALTFSGPVPAGLSVRLPPGSRPIHPVPAPAARTPRAVESRKLGVALSLVVPDDVVDLFEPAMAHELERRLRHELALVYSVDTHRVQIDDQTCTSTSSSTRSWTTSLGPSRPRCPWSAD